MAFINDSFMIGNNAGVRLYQDVAKSQPVIDYHCHLDAKDIYENKSFEDITKLWLAGDHYKWRAMRANGIPENKITGTASAEEKFQAWAETVESCFGNPLYHWTHLELHNYFGFEGTLNGKNWREVMNHCNKLLRQNDFKPRALIPRSCVEVICTTDSPLDSLDYHRLLQQDDSFKTKVLPTFRPDEIFEPQPEAFKVFIHRLSQLVGNEISTLDDFNQAIAQRIDWFHEAGCRISDHGPLEIGFYPADECTVAALFVRKCQGEQLGAKEQAQFDSAMFLMLAQQYKMRDWAMQIHFGAIRNNNTSMRNALGINMGFDSINDQCHLARHLNGLLDAMSMQNALPKTIIYNLNARDNDVVASTIANFQSGESGIKSPVQFGSGWWFNDTRRGMENQLNSLADQGLLMNFIGMLTDSRSFVSYPRHDYFRRILCNLVGGWVERGEVPDDAEALSKLIKNVCHDNAERYFGF